MTAEESFQDILEYAGRQLIRSDCHGLAAAIAQTAAQALAKLKSEEVCNLMGYRVEESKIALDIIRHIEQSTLFLKNELAKKEVLFEQFGGRGVKIAEEIDSLRIALECRK